MIRYYQTRDGYKPTNTTVKLTDTWVLYVNMGILPCVDTGIRYGYKHAISRVGGDCTTKVGALCARFVDMGSPVKTQVKNGLSKFLAF